MVLHRDTAPLGERRLVLGQVKSIWPVVIGRRSEDPEYLEDLIDLTVTGEQGAPLSHFSENAPSGPEVHSEAVRLLAEEDLGAAVPECDHLVRVRLDREAEGPCEAEISQLDLGARGVHKKILRL